MSTLLPILLTALITLPPLVFSVMLHEIAHGWVAKKLGDPTAAHLGRLTLNPISHIDPVMTILVPGMLLMTHSPVFIGGAKPVPVDPSFFKNPKRDMTLVAAAGPVTNFVLAFLCYLLVVILQAIRTDSGSISHGSPLDWLTYGLLIWSGYGLLINIVLAVFNLMPIPPLDGGRIAVGLLPNKWAYQLSKLEPYGFLIIVGLLYLGVFDLILNPLLTLIMFYVSNELVIANNNS